MLTNAKTRSAFREANRSKTMYIIGKRFTDIIVSFIVLLLCLPLFLCVCYCIRRQEGSPIFHKSKCAGVAGDSFMMHTFRTMTNRSRVIRALPPHPYPKSWEHGVPNQFSFRYTPVTTYTSIGLWLEKLSLDKLPLFYHVLVGEMSLVGPTPELCDITMYYNEYQKQRLSVKPGITGYAQIKEFSTDQYDQQVQADLYYIQQRSYLFDLKIVVQAFSRIFLTSDRK